MYMFIIFVYVYMEFIFEFIYLGIVFTNEHVFFIIRSFTYRKRKEKFERKKWPE